MNKIRASKCIKLHGVTPKSTNNLFVWFGGSKYKPATTAIKSYHYRDWRNAFIDLLPESFIPEGDKDIHLFIEVSVFKEFDLDNTLKGIIDALQLKYKFNDNEISYLVCRKVTVGTFEKQETENHYVKICLLDKFYVIEDENTNNAMSDVAGETIHLMNQYRDYDRYSKSDNLITRNDILQ